MTHRFNKSLANRALRRMAGMMLVPLIVAGIVLVVDAYGDTRSRQTQLLDTVGRAMAGPLSESVWMVDSSLLERQLQAMTQIPGIAHVAVTTFIGQEFHADKLGYQGSERFMARRLELRHQSDPLGQLEIWGDSDLLLREVVVNVIEAFIILIALLGVGLIGVSLAFRREVSQPLSVIADYLEKTASHQEQVVPLAEQLPSDTGRELQGVASAIDRLRQSLREQSRG